MSEDKFKQNKMYLSVLYSITSGFEDCPPRMHSHYFEELVIVYDGSAVHLAGDQECVVSSGDVFFIPIGYSHGFLKLNDYKAINILFCREQLKLPDYDLMNLPGYYALFELEPELRAGKGSAPCLTLDSQALVQVRNIAEQIKLELSQQTSAYRYRALAIFMELEVLLLRCYEMIESHESASLLQLGTFMSFLEHNYHKKITVSEMAKAVKTSERTLNRLCHEAFGESPKHYLLNLRLSKAKQLLCREKCRVSHVAFKVGFSDSNYFTKQYKKKYLCTPKNASLN
jgi:AraC-like DNA-binding protein/mannose-6-phosphate isomerase-like protein (cupin superfamily)